MAFKDLDTLVRVLGSFTDQPSPFIHKGEKREYSVARLLLSPEAYSVIVLSIILLTSKSRCIGLKKTGS